MKLVYKEFKKSRICVIDSFPILYKSIQDVVATCENNNIPFNFTGRGSGDVHNLFYHFCIENIFSAHKKCKSNYPKVIMIYPFMNYQKQNKIANFFANSKNFEKILKVIPFPYCKCSTYNDKEMESAAISSIEKHKIDYNKITKFANVKKLINILNKLKNKKVADNGLQNIEDNEIDEIDKENLSTIDK